MQLSSHRLGDYRLAAYVVVAALIAGGVTFAFDRLTAPSGKVQANGAPVSNGAVRQIPIARTSAADLGDPENKLTPVYPASPGKDLPVKDTPVVQAAKPVETNGSATPNMSPAAVAAQPPVAAQPAISATAQPAAAATMTPANACNVAACASAYRSFRESDCSYQPLAGPRRLCEGSPDANTQASATQQQQQQQPQPQPSRRYDANSAVTVGRGGYDDALRDAERTVRRLPPPPGRYDDDDDSNVTVIETPQQRYDFRRNWISEPGD
jgi:hypothetical protein